MRIEYATMKRGLDVVASATGLAALAPVLAVVALAVRIDSRGPALYGHERVGRHGKRFTVWKFRTMVDGADRKGAPLTAGGDPRVTRVGKVLRASKLDELPQLFNVLKGEMSLVGPRPEAPKWVALFEDDYAEILSVRPGITDEASIRFRSEEDVLAAAADPARAYVEQVLPEKIELYKRYLRTQSLRTDLWILARTLGKVLRP